MSLFHWSQCHCLDLFGATCSSLGNHSQGLANPRRGWVQAHLEPDLLDQQGHVELLSVSVLLSGQLRLLGDLLLWPGE